METRTVDRHEVAQTVLSPGSSVMAYMHMDDETGSLFKTSFEGRRVFVAMLNGEDGVLSRDGSIYLEFEGEIDPDDPEIARSIDWVTGYDG